MTKPRALSPDFVSRQEAANRLMLTPRQIDRLTRAGKLPKVKISGNRSGIPRAAFENYLSTRPSVFFDHRGDNKADANILGLFVTTTMPMTEFLARICGMGYRGIFSVACDPPASFGLVWHQRLGLAPSDLQARLVREGMLPILLS